MQYLLNTRRQTKIYLKNKRQRKIFKMNLDKK